MAYTSKSAQDALDKYGRHVEKGTDDSGGKWKSVETNNKLKETYKKGGYKSKQVTDRETGEIKSTVTKTPGGKEVEREGKKRYVRKENYRKEGETEAMKAGAAARKAARKIGLKSQKTVNPNK